MFVKSILDEKGPELICALESDSIQKVAQLFKNERIGFAIVTDSNQNHVGTVSERDIVQAVADIGEICTSPISEIMTQNVVSVSPDDDLETVRDIMTERRTRHVLVKDDNKVVGVVSIGDLIKHSLAECKIDAAQMQQYISGTGYQ
ncbi:CBS domain-containing protein [Magnetovibrio sp. PR-2]|uniref:CBS domain-containing protein n=1 Tax=Magnetovibrio sp. PR-2 TaxID=3120356 RepID=UPI002FCE6021